MTKNQRNILAVYKKASQEEIEIGKEWYTLAGEQAMKISSDYNVLFTRVAGVIAALSPNQTWKVNLEAARKLIYAFTNGVDKEMVKVATYGINKDKAWRILSEDQAPLSILSGNKVQSFYKNIVSPSQNFVTIDGHAYDVWYGKREGTRLETASSEKKHLDRNGLYQRIEADYQAVANELGLIPNQLQSITWLTWRRLHEVRQAKNEGYLYRRDE